jgi:DNA-binding MarR family transcriptional regulator
MTRRDQVLALLAIGHHTYDDDEIAVQLGMNRHYVNQICRKLAAEGVVERYFGHDGKYVNRVVRSDDSSAAMDARSPTPSPATRVRRVDRARSNVEALITDFGARVGRFESSSAFPGPSLYFHTRALARRGLYNSAEELLDDEQFLEYVYAVLPAWGMHRMGKQTAKVVDFCDMVSSMRAAAPRIDQLWGRQITKIGTNDADQVARAVWAIIASLRVSRSETRIVAGSKALHHVLPELVPPIDSQYTFRFFTGQKVVNRGDEHAFLEWFPLLCEIGRRCADEIAAALERGGVMATSQSKVIDNAIIGFMQRQDGGRDGAA